MPQSFVPSNEREDGKNTVVVMHWTFTLTIAYHLTSHFYLYDISHVQSYWFSNAIQHRDAQY